MFSSRPVLRRGFFWLYLYSHWQDCHEHFFYSILSTMVMKTLRSASTFPPQSNCRHPEEKNLVSKMRRGGNARHGPARPLVAARLTDYPNCLGSSSSSSLRGQTSSSSDTDTIMILARLSLLRLVLVLTSSRSTLTYHFLSPCGNNWWPQHRRGTGGPRNALCRWLGDRGSKHERVPRARNQPQVHHPALWVVSHEARLGSEIDIND